jgi:hypothetical protein
VQGRSRQTTSEGKLAPTSALSLTIDTEGVSLTSDRIFVRRTPIGYLCAGFGDSSKLLRFAFGGEKRNPSHFDAACRRLDKSIVVEGLAKVRRLGLEIPLGAIEDNHMRRLAIAVALLKAGFDPNQSRDDHGRWTDDGAGASTTGANATTAEIGAVSVASSVAAVADEVISSPGWKLWGRVALEALPRIAAELTGPLAMAGGLILMPTNESLISEGTLPGRPDVAYKANEIELTLYHVDDQGQRTPFFVSRPDADRFYRDEQGNVVGRFVNGAFVLDPAGAAVVLPTTAGDKIDEKDETPEERKTRIAALVVQAIAKVRTADPQELCPDPAPDRAGAESASPRTRAYQEQVTRLPYGVAFYLNDVNFDGCRYWGDGDMLEAKGEGFEQHLTEDGKWESYWKGWQGDVKQMTKQAATAAYFGKNVEWHVAEKPIADLLQAYAESQFPNVKVIWDPPRSGRRDKRDLVVQRPDAGFIEQMRQLASPAAPRYWIGAGPSGRPILVPAPAAA